MTRRTRFLGAPNLAKPAIIMLYFAVLKLFFTSGVTIAEDLLASTAFPAIFCHHTDCIDSKSFLSECELLISEATRPFCDIVDDTLEKFTKVPGHIGLSGEGSLKGLFGFGIRTSFRFLHFSGKTPSLRHVVNVSRNQL